MCVCVCVCVCEGVGCCYLRIRCGCWSEKLGNLISLFCLQEYLANLGIMLKLLVRSMMKMLASGPSLIKPFNDSIAAFLTSCFGLMDRGYVLSLVKSYCAIVSREQMNSTFVGLMVRWMCA